LQIKAVGLNLESHRGLKGPLQNPKKQKKGGKKKEAKLKAYIELEKSDAWSSRSNLFNT